MKYQRFLEPQQEDFLVDLGKKHGVELSFTWSKDKQALKSALQQYADSMSENSSKIDMMELTQKLNKFVQLAQKLEQRMETLKNEVKSYKQEWNKLLNAL
jgi:uncharacterized protein YlxW (UPF0749 family)